MECRLCGNDTTHLKYSVDSFENSFDVYECGECGFIFQDIDESKAYSFYDEAYYVGGKEFTYIDERANEEACRFVWNARMKKLARNDFSDAKDKVYLDVGCSFGGLMQCAEESGYDAYGVEISPYSGAYAQKRFGDERVYTGNIEEIALPQDTFSAISMIEVIEHVYRPRRALKNIYASMKKGGVALIQTADMDGLQARRGGKEYHYYLPGHLSYFNRYNIQSLMKEVGFTRTKYIGGVEFGLLPKLRKSAASFEKWSDYAKWLRIAWYHMQSKVTLGSCHLTSSMVVMGWK